MSENEQLSAVVIGIASDASKLMEAWEVLRMLFLDYTDSLIEALTPIAETFGRPYLSAEELEDLFRPVNTIEPTGTPPKKIRHDISKPLSRSTKHYNYIPRASRNLPYMRRVY